MSVIAVAGGTGYIGGRLVPRLVEEGHRVRLLTRQPESLRDIPWKDDVDVVEGGLQDSAAAAALCEGAETVYYLVHSMSGSRKFTAVDDECARILGAAAAAAGVQKIIYLSGLHPEGELSEHLASRVRVGEILQDSGVPVLTLQAGLVIGSGSASFEMIRHLTDVLPVMPAPKWVLNRVQPIAVRDALHYLLGAAQAEIASSATYDIGGPQAYTYGQLMQMYAEAAGLHRPRIVPLPVLTPWLASQWVNLVTPIPRTLAIPLVGSLQHDCLVHDRGIDRLIPPPAAGLTDYPRAVRLALEKIAGDAVETTWATAQPTSVPSEPLPSDPDWAGRRVYQDDRTMTTAASPERVFAVIEKIGGETGYYALSGAWAMRGTIDKLVGGVGLRRGRRQRERLALGDALDWWRVEEIEPDRLLRLRAEMKVPGKAWLELSVVPEGAGSRYRQRAIFFPRGLSGRLYWLAVLPFHGVIFASMARRIIAEAEEAQPI